MKRFRDCWKEADNQSWLARLFACVPTWLDCRFRWNDFRFNRSYGGWMKKLGLDGHSPLAFLLPAALLVFLVVGPTCSWVGGWALVWLFAGWAVLFAAARISPDRWLLPIEVGVLALWAILLWWRAPSGALEAENTLYRHFLTPLYLFAVAPPLLFLWWGWILRLTFSRARREPFFGDFLPHVNLFAPPPRPLALDGFSLLRAFVYVPMRYPLHLLFVPSLVVLLLPYYIPVQTASLVAVLGWWLLLAAIADHRLERTLQLMQRAFFIGGQLVVSLAVIVLAGGRVAGISYIQTVVESSNLRTLLGYITSAYVVFWFYEYWLNRLLLEKLLDFLRRSDGGERGKVEYSLDPDETELASSSVEADDRRIQIHGGGRFVSIGNLKRPGGPSQLEGKEPEEAFEPFEKGDLFETLVHKAAWSDQTGGVARSRKSYEKLEQIKRGIRFYFSFANLLLFILGGLAIWWLGTRVQDAALVLPIQSHEAIGTANPGRPVHLAQTLWPTESTHEETEPRDHVILLAASGGGTRAALYTESVLRGLALHDALDDVVLASGVSGGGTALAYLGAHWDVLTHEVPPSDAWDRFACDLSRPFIWDVLEGSAEWRIVSGTRSNKLLQESFERGFGFPQERDPGASPPPPVPTLGEAKLGLIFNTSLAGHLEARTTSSSLRLAEAAARQRQSTDSSVAGGRLILTNLKLEPDFPGPSAGDPDLRLNYVVLDDLDVPLTTAAALHANFPPVFSNAPIDRWAESGEVGTDSYKEGDRYWVTDGGAVENRGLISLLLALREAVATLDPANPPLHLPEIHIVLAEASAGSHRYSQDRGIGTSFGAAGKMANQLAAELLREIEGAYASVCHGPGSTGFNSDAPHNCGKIVYHDLAMPEILRIDSGLGTHWMLPRTVEVHRNGQSLKLSSEAARHAIHALHQADLHREPLLCHGEGSSQVGQTLERIQERLRWTESREVRLNQLLTWIQDPKSEHQKAWNRFLCKYKGSGCSEE